jgi:hypothetical protein
MNVAGVHAHGTQAPKVLCTSRCCELLRTLDKVTAEEARETVLPT